MSGSCPLCRGTVCTCPNVVSGHPTATIVTRPLTVLEAHSYRDCPDIAKCWARDYHRTAQIQAVQALIDHAKKVSPSDRMTVYVGDLEHALGQRDERARTRTGANGSGDAGGAEQ